MTDIAIIGGGPAGLSAAINARIRNKTVLLVTNDYKDSYLAKAERVDNYLGLPGLGGQELMEQFRKHAESQGVEEVNKRVISVMPMGESFFLSYESEVAEAKTIILTTGVVPAGKLPGEGEFLGKGVSYCATCDGMLYRGRKVVVVGKSADAVEEANYLHEIGCQVTFVADKEGTRGLAEGVELVTAKRLEIRGDKAAEALIADGREIPADGIFILRQAISPQDIMQGIQVENGSIVTNKRMETSIPGVFAAGDCTGRPYQIAKAVGEGQVAALYAAEYIDKMKKEN
ncbi:NAD(P)/FAD-dependent oxidoreductase [Papillibacter cinnamivorans]|uniref:Thioredoxin reductase (NADPH) n=1 Tax=Papillibacter cinnamivorans DSM 12816 TaxID=1122930 RepID=A0A1W1ZGS9_9FIRM|nr:NAD(P)/FAD-dependent oxidoreductase [Papillibacter cinnamivorans]SMC47745.1 thioredoxin reductase (NADPH) [Papillibacter cinnamivorans DSM 12816]